MVECHLHVALIGAETILANGTRLEHSAKSELQDRQENEDLYHGVQDLAYRTRWLLMWPSETN